MANKSYTKDARARQLRNQQLKAEWVESERRLGRLVEAALSGPPHLVDRAVEQLWENEIVDDSTSSAVLGEWMDALLEDDPEFLRLVLERWLKYRRPLPSAPELTPHTN